MSIIWNTRVETTADVDTIRDITLQAFGRQFEVDYLDAHRSDPVAWIPGLSIVATTPDDRPIAYALLTRCHIGEVPVLSLGPVAVLAQALRPQPPMAKSGTSSTSPSRDCGTNSCGGSCGGGCGGGGCGGCSS